MNEVFLYINFNFAFEPKAPRKKTIWCFAMVEWMTFIRAKSLQII